MTRILEKYSKRVDKMLWCHEVDCENIDRSMKATYSVYGKDERRGLKNVSVREGVIGMQRMVGLITSGSNT